MTRHPLSGVYAAALTPLKKDASSPDLEAVAPYLAFLAARGCHGALIFGTTGEGPSFSPSEREAVWQSALRVREQYPNFRLLAGTGTPSLTETIELTRAAFDLGYDGVVTLPPYYFRKATDDGLFNWFRELIHKAVPADGYLLGYNFPGVAGIGFSLDLLARLKDAFPVQFAGIKDSSHDPDFARALGQKFEADLAVFTGTDSDFTLALQNHATGCITAPANLLSPDLREIYNAFEKPDFFITPEAERSGVEKPGFSHPAQIRVTHQRHILEKYPPFPPTLKALVHRLHGFPRWPVRPPLENLTPKTEEKLMSEFK
ncbi:MAG: dihydrodipicolinate synthase family protein [Anaerolineaceae bacterium]|nr:MAG: dihydrodipicolinate synthase family protein [Anaerolineaceae bacterium]